MGEITTLTDKNGNQLIPRTTPEAIQIDEIQTLSNVLGNTDISHVGDGTITGNINRFNTDTIKYNKEYYDPGQVMQEHEERFLMIDSDIFVFPVTQSDSVYMNNEDGSFSTLTDKIGTWDLSEFSSGDLTGAIYQNHIDIEFLQNQINPWKLVGNGTSVDASSVKNTANEYLVEVAINITTGYIANFSFVVPKQKIGQVQASGFMYDTSYYGSVLLKTANNKFELDTVWTRIVSGGNVLDSTPNITVYYR